MKTELKITAMQLAFVAAIIAAAYFVAGCSVTKVNYERDEKGVVSYRLYRNDHWLKTSGTGISGGMTKDGKFEFAAEGLERSPSEEFNRTMMTYTSAFIQLAQIAAAAYNPSASMAGGGNKETTVNVLPAGETNGTAGTNGTTASGYPAAAEAMAAEQQATGAATSQGSGASSQDSGLRDPHCADGDCSDGGCTDCEEK